MYEPTLNPQNKLPVQRSTPNPVLAFKTMNIEIFPINKRNGPLATGTSRYSSRSKKGSWNPDLDQLEALFTDQFTERSLLATGSPCPICFIRSRLASPLKIAIDQPRRATFVLPYSCFHANPSTPPPPPAPPGLRASFSEKSTVTSRQVSDFNLWLLEGFLRKTTPSHHQTDSAPNHQRVLVKIRGPHLLVHVSIHQGLPHFGNLP